MRISAQKSCREVSENRQMSEISHSSGQQRENGKVLSPWRVLGGLAPLGLIVFTFVYFSAHFGEYLLDRLAAGDPDPARRVKVDGLRATRALLATSSTTNGELLWQARRSDGAAGFFLAGAVRAEKLGKSEDARAWLALELLSRGDKATARVMAAQAGGLALPEMIKPADPATWENEAIGKKVKESLGLK